MSCILHQAIEKYNVLKYPTTRIAAAFRQNKTVHKVALLINHIFRAAAMVAFAQMLPYSAPVCIGIGFIGSLFYRLTVETHCAYKFALPAFAGAVSFSIGQQALTDLICGVAFSSLSVFAVAFVSIVPLIIYATYSVLTVNYDVENR